jgi:hypothetical protein
MDNREYRANLTGAWFLFYEIKQVIKLIQKGMTDKEIKQVVFEENLFQYDKKSSITRAFPSVLRRARLLSDELRKVVIEGSMENSKLVNLLAITLDDLLFEEFMQEVIREKYHNNDLILEKKDVNVFFTHKAEQSEKVRSFSVATVNKLRQVYFKILVESGVLSDVKTGELNRIYLDEHLKLLLKENDNHEFIKIFETE